MKLFLSAIALLASTAVSAETLSFSNIRNLNGRADGTSFVVTNTPANKNVYTGTMIACTYNFSCRKYPLTNVRVTSGNLVITFPWRSWETERPLQRAGKMYGKTIRFSDTAEQYPIGVMFDCSEGRAADPRVACPDHTRFRLRSWFECDNGSCGD